MIDAGGIEFAPEIGPGEIVYEGVTVGWLVYSFAMGGLGWLGLSYLESVYDESSQGCDAYGRVLAAADWNVEEQ